MNAMNAESTQSFFGSTPREALGAVRAALGDDAVIVDTREVLIAAGVGAEGTRSQRRYEVRVQAPNGRHTAPVLSPPLEPKKAVPSAAADLDLHPTIARRLFERGRRIEANAVTASTSAFEQAVSELLTFTRAPWAATNSPRRTIAVVGPTGGGKTTTLAKIAARAILESKKVALITTDTWRVGAVQHLARYAEILSLPCYVAGNDEELQRALAHSRGVDLVLIDTAGRAPGDPGEAKEVARFRSTPQIETHVVVSSSTSESQLRRLKTRYEGYGPSGLIVTKLDEAEGPGGLIGCSALLGLPLAALSAGQDVPDDIHGANLRDILHRLGGAA